MSSVCGAECHTAAEGTKSHKQLSWHTLRSYYPDSAEMSDHIQAPGPMQVQSKKKI